MSRVKYKTTKLIFIYIIVATESSCARGRKAFSHPGSRSPAPALRAELDVVIPPLHNRAAGVAAVEGAEGDPGGKRCRPLPGGHRPPDSTARAARPFPLGSKPLVRTRRLKAPNCRDWTRRLS